MLISLVNKAKSTTRKYWKWFLGFLIAGVLAYTAWRLKCKLNEIEALRAEKLLFHMRAKDLKTQTKNERDEDAAQVLRTRAEAYEAAAADKDTKIQLVREQINEAKESVKSARDWQELERQAKGETP